MFEMDDGMKCDQPARMKFTERKYCFPGRTLLFVLTGVFFFAAVTFCAAFLVVYFKYENRGINKECRTMDCIQTAAMIASKMDSTANPCEDFDEYACGKFKSEILDEDEYERRASILLTKDVDKTITAIMSEEIQEGDLNSTVNLKNLYHSCMDEDQIEEIGLQPFLDSDYAAEWPTLIGESWDGSNFDLNDVIARYMEIDIEPLFSLEFSYDPRNTSQICLLLREPSMKLPSSNSSRHESPVLFLEDYETELAKLFGANSSVATADTAAKIDLESALDKIKEEKSVEETYLGLSNPVPLGALKTKYPFVDIPRVLRAVFAVVNITLEDDREIYIANPSYFENLAKVLETADNRTLMNLFAFPTAAKKSKMLTRATHRILQDSARRMLSVEINIDRPNMCKDILEETFAKPLAREYSRTTFSGASKTYVKTMLENIKATFEEILQQATWLTSKTKQEALVKLSKLRIDKIGYPDSLFSQELEDKYQILTMTKDNFYKNMETKSRVFRDYELRLLNKPSPKEEWDIQPYVMNGVYNRHKNEITLTAAFLQPPHFSLRYPNYINYGVLGYVIGHETTHGFDTHGSQYDQDGNVRNWWAQEDWDKFREKTMCLVDQYGKFRDDSIGMNVDGVLTLDENVADNGGLKVSYRAYKKLVKEKDESARLPGLELSQDQLFFLGYAQFHCQNSRKSAARAWMKKEAHAMGRYRTLGVLQNSPDFAKAFNCPLGSPMIYIETEETESGMVKMTAKKRIRERDTET